MSFADNLASPFIKHLEHDVQELFGFIAIDGSSNVIGVAPTAASTPVGAGPYSMCKGLLGNVGVAGSVVYQPHTATGVYTFVLDKAWYCLLDCTVTPLDPGAVVLPTWTVTANVRASTATGPNGGRPNGADPGTSASVAAQTVIVRFRTVSTGALVDPTVNTGFWIRLVLKRTAIG